mmetsp:Transcript_28875/g.72508  ORF Transcript_28875/g.72508 Transcript_28875/m.72508 type:complete len:269 (-) Transcript_28875:109-915(-)
MRQTQIRVHHRLHSNRRQRHARRRGRRRGRLHLLNQREHLHQRCHRHHCRVPRRLMQQPLNIHRAQPHRQMRPTQRRGKRPLHLHHEARVLSRRIVPKRRADSARHRQVPAALHAPPRRANRRGLGGVVEEDPARAKHLGPRGVGVAGRAEGGRGGIQAEDGGPEVSGLDGEVRHEGAAHDRAVEVDAAGAAVAHVLGLHLRQGGVPREAEQVFRDVVRRHGLFHVRVLQHLVIQPPQNMRIVHRVAGKYQSARHHAIHPNEPHRDVL